MNFKQEQISELILNIANSENGTNLLMQLTLTAFMKSERQLHQQENPDTYANGYRERKASGFGKEMVLKRSIYSNNNYISNKFNPLGEIKLIDF
jgi:hypothetical protein